MINQKVETEGDYSDYAQSETEHGKEDSVSCQPEGMKGRLESMKKLKKVRSIRLRRFSSMRSSTGRGKSHHENLSMLSSVGTQETSCWRDTPIEMFDASPSYMKATTSSQAKESFHITQRLPTKKTLTRVSTLKLKRSLSKKPSGRNEQKRKLKSSRSIKLGTVKGSRSTRKISESIDASDDQNMESATSSGNKSQRVITGRLSLKPVRILTKMPTVKTKNPSIENSTLHRATCSSTLKDSHFPDHNINLPQEGSGSQGVPTVRVCPYTYCSLHGHRHGNAPPLKRFVSMRRRMLKAQKSMKMDGGPATRSKKATQRTRTVQGEDGTSQFHNVKRLARDDLHMKPHDSPASSDGSTYCEEDGETHNFLRCNAEVSLGETSFPHMINFEENHGNSYAVEGHAFVAMKETNMESCCIATEKANSDSKVTETGWNVKNIAAFEKNDEISTVESTSTDVEAATIGQNMEQDYEVMQMRSAHDEANPACTTSVAYKMKERDHKYIKMWHLMYKHAVSSNTGKEENKAPFDDGNNKEVRGLEEAHSLNGASNSSCQDVDDENNDVIQLVQKAVDEILLSETEDLPFDNDSKSSGIGSDEVLIEKSEDERGKGNTSTSIESPKEETKAKDRNFRRHEGEITSQRMGSKPEQRTPKSWSSLKRLILLKRFVKALEKVRKLNLRRPRHLPAEDAHFEAEKVSLKHQTAEEKKNAEDWMLDYALQKVISKLAPAQRQRVTLLVEAFETILPFQDGENVLQSSSAVETQANPMQSLDDYSDHSNEETDKDNVSDNPVPKLHCPIVLDNPLPTYVTTEEKILKGKQSLASLYDNEEVPFNEIVNEVPEDLISNLDSENPNSESESPGRDSETKNLIGDNGEQFSKAKSLILNGLVRSFGSHMVGGSGLAPAQLLDEPTEDRKGMIEKATMETRSLEGFPTHELSEAPRKQNYKGLWYLVYKHMKSDITENNSESLQIDGTDEEDSGHKGSRTRGTSVENATKMNQDTSFKDHGIVADLEFQLQQMEAIKMVEEAIDSILPDVQDNTISDNFKESNETERVHSEEGLTQNEEKMATKEQEREEEPTAPNEGNKPNQQLPRSWSNLKKVILLRRFLKSLEKVRKFNPRGPRYLPVDPDSEAEKVNLRHQDMAERKGTEEWMLDYALRQVVSKLTPARKRKVELLVEAFETVIPTFQS